MISVHGIDPKSSDLLARAGVPDLASLAALANSEPRMREVWRAICFMANHVKRARTAAPAAAAAAEGEGEEEEEE